MKVYTIVVETNADISDDEIERAERAVGEIFGTVEIETVLETEYDLQDL